MRMLKMLILPLITSRYVNISSYANISSSAKTLGVQSLT